MLGSSRAGKAEPSDFGIFVGGLRGLWFIPSDLIRDLAAVVPASSSPQVVPFPLSVAAAVDPEEAFVVSLSSCHMLEFPASAA